MVHHHLDHDRFEILIITMIVKDSCVQILQSGVYQYQNHNEGEPVDVFPMKLEHIELVSVLHVRFIELSTAGPYLTLS